MAEYTTLTSKGQVTVPKEIRDKLNWKEGIKLRFYIDGEELKVKEVTIIDEIEDLLVKDLVDLGYNGEEYANVDYRIIYTVDEEGKLIIIALVGTRENLYQELERKI